MAILLSCHSSLNKLIAEIKMDSKRWGKVQAVFQDAVDKAEGERYAFVVEVFRRQRPVGRSDVAAAGALKLLLSI